MGKASRRKRERALVSSDLAAATVEHSATRGARPLRHLLTIAAVVVGVLALSLGTWLHYSGAETRGAEYQPGPSAVTVLPNPDTSDMTAPVSRAIRSARQAALSQPKSATAVGQFGQVLHAHWQYDAAATCYEFARQLAPGEFRWIYLLAGVEEIRGAESERIVQLFGEAIRLAPRFAPVRVRHADALLRLGHWADAREEYTAAVALDPVLVLAHRGLGQAATLLGDLPAAIKHLERAAALSSQDRITQVALARAYAMAGQVDQAAEAARNAQGLTYEASLPDQVYFELSLLAVDPETLRERFTRSLGAGDENAAFEAAILLEESGAPSARQQLSQASKQRANQYAFAGEFDAALAEFERAARFAPTDPEIEHNWGTVLLRRGDLEQASRHFEKAVALNPQSTDSLYNLGVVLEGLGRNDEAIARFTAAVKINPQHMAADRLAELGVVSEP